MKTWQKVLIITLSILVVLGTGTVIGINTLLNKLGRNDGHEIILPEDEFFVTDENVNGYEIVDPASIEWPSKADSLGEGDVTNILLIGLDSFEDSPTARSDSMIIASINDDSNEIRLISLMRDTYVQIPGYSDNRLNAAYAFGGTALLNETLFLNFGVEIDANVEVNFDSFVTVIDTIGGVEINISQEEADFINEYYNKPNKKPYINYGIVHMDGETALFYARIRWLEGWDFARTERQRKVISAVINKARNSDFETVLSFINTLFPMVNTDLSNAEIVSYAIKYFPLLSDSYITMYRIPEDCSYYDANIRGMSVLVPDLEECRERLIEIIY